jgi:hypothetical protein
MFLLMAPPLSLTPHTSNMHTPRTYIISMVPSHTSPIHSFLSRIKPTMKIPSVLLLLLSALGAVEAFSAGSRTTSVMPSSSSTSLNAEETRRSWLQSSSYILGSAILSATSPQAAFAKVATDASSLDADLPPVSFICVFFCDPCQSAHYCSLLLQCVMSLPGCSEIISSVQILSSTCS